MGEFRYIGEGALTAKAFRALERAVNESANHLVAQAVDAAPIEEGTLRASIHTDGAKVGIAVAGLHMTGVDVTAIVATGGEASDYAIVQHEHTEYRHPRGGGAKFIERPLLDNRPFYLEAIARAARSEF